MAVPLVDLEWFLPADCMLFDLGLLLDLPAVLKADCLEIAAVVVGL